jgi:hypothetical protein
VSGRMLSGSRARHPLPMKNTPNIVLCQSFRRPDSRTGDKQDQTEFNPVAYGNECYKYKTRGKLTDDRDKEDIRVRTYRKPRDNSFLAYLYPGSLSPSQRTPYCEVRDASGGGGGGRQRGQRGRDIQHIFSVGRLLRMIENETRSK